MGDYYYYDTLFVSELRKPATVENEESISIAETIASNINTKIVQESEDAEKGKLHFPLIPELV